MKEEVLIYIDNCFESIVEGYNFKKVIKINDERDFLMEFHSKGFNIILESYRRELYCNLSKENDSELKIQIFNLLEYLNINSDNIPNANYFKDERNIELCYKKQIKYLSDIIYDNYAIIYNFFNQDKLEVRFNEIRVFMINKYPHLFKQIK